MVLITSFSDLRGGVKEPTNLDVVFCRLRVICRNRAAFCPSLRELPVQLCALSTLIMEPQKYLQRSIRKREKLVLTENKLNIYCVKLQRIKKVTLIVLAPFEVPLHVPLQVQVSLNVRARNSPSLLLILIGQDSLPAPLLL